MGFKKTFALVLIGLFLISNVSFQPATVKGQPNNLQAPAIQWQKEYGDNDTESVSNLIQTSDGGYAFLDLGYSYQLNPVVPSTFYKVDSSGNLQWTKTIKLFTASNLIQTSDGGYEIAGEWNTYGTTNQITPTIIKLNSKGDIRWYENTSTVLKLAIASSNIHTSDGGFAYEESGGIIKTDSNGNIQWVKNLTFSQYNDGINLPLVLSSLIETKDGALAGLGVGSPYAETIDGNIYLIKTETFLPLPSQTLLPTPITTPITTPVLTTYVIAIAFVIVVIGISIVLLICRRHRKNR